MSATLVIGGGVVGATTLLELASRGEHATLVEAAHEPGLGASFANGGMLTPSMPQPWNTPGVWKHLLGSLFDPHAALKLNLTALPSYGRWGLEFLRNSSPARHRRATEAIYLLASYSMKRMDAIERANLIEFDQASAGTMAVFASAASFQYAVEAAERLAPLGLEFETVSATGTFGIEPHLAESAHLFTGGIRYPGDRSGDARKFTSECIRRSIERGGKLRMGLKAKGVVLKGGQIAGVRTQEGILPAKRVVICAGAQSPGLLRNLGLRLSVKPVKGYSITYQLPDHADLPRLPVIDEEMHAAVVPIGKRIRVVGTAEFAGFDRRLSAARLANLDRIFARLYPSLVHRTIGRDRVEWAGLRPMSADGLPFIGASPVNGLYLNTGHGFLGWTMAAGSAALLADIMLGHEPVIDPQPYRYR
ncbi:FAD-dependent oxidoreductase [Pacificimonas sp. WHA3]|uniref:FAD-dependent oxidoreductase n=1 Tax=Pacificimonas pallii TaxID=2827236 RepID=A0ABS6SAE3_9SPHN|nr:FAD-dependent oxidoreductase [Pacificimonas pallii]MBV7255304.1 FAD-dependent oxidoreductase [Pacificimonas pallii]